MGGVPRYDAVVVGAGHNGLVAGAYLARNGSRVLIVERRDRVGGVLGFAQTVGRLRPSVIRDLRLASHGLQLISPEVRVFAPQPDGGAVTLWADPRRTAEELRPLSAHDAAAFPAFDRRVRTIASFLAYLDSAAPPQIQNPSLGDAFAGLRLARAFRRMGPRARREALRVLPMPVADLVGEAFERDDVRAAVAARAVTFTAMGPWTAGTSAVASTC